MNKTRDLAESLTVNQDPIEQKLVTLKRHLEDIKK